MAAEPSLRCYHRIPFFEIPGCVWNKKKRKS